MSQGKIIREIILDELERELVGPHQKDESFELYDNPKSMYWSGVLYPIQTNLTEDEYVQQNSIQIENSEESDDEEEIPISIGTKPSSLGITCHLPIAQKSILAKISYGRYVKEESNESNNVTEPKPNSNKKLDKDEKKSNIKYSWRRIDYDLNPIPIHLNGNGGEVQLPNDKNIFIKYNIKKIRNEYIILNIFLTNESFVKSKTINDSECIFQPKIRLESSDNSKVFLNLSKITQTIQDETDKMMLFLFRNEKHFAHGRNCSVEWDINENENRTNWIQTTFIPHYNIPEIKPLEPTNWIKKSLNMKFLSNVSDFKQFKDILSPITDGYEKWIQELKDQLQQWEQDTEYRIEKEFMSQNENIPKQCIDECNDALERIRTGIDKVSTEPLVGEAFRFTNEVMYQNILHSKWAKQNRDKIKNGKKITENNPDPTKINPEWRLFQIAFLLLNIESIINKDSKDHATVDLLWFPTGGGKTEAYYGVIVFMLAYRRLKGKDSKSLDEQLDRYGVSAIMRYTYRLLTLQQFQRAATLLCACEYVRMKNKNNIEKFGDEPFLVGLWAGMATTPNSFADAKSKIMKKQKTPNISIKEGDPIQLLNCPWCGQELDPHSYEFENAYENIDTLRPKRIQIRCNKRCFFGKPNDPDRVLPVVFVDDDIINLRPSLLISTVDKFTQISWQPRYSTLFGNVSQFCKQHGYKPKNVKDEMCKHAREKKFKDGHSRTYLGTVSRQLSPPELIIQDELHLIVGPLGTLTSLYETAIDELSTNNQIRPKIITSTATAKKSNEQIKDLFNLRTTKIFPPQGFKFGESYFAKSLPISDENPGKLHIGVCSTTTSGYNVGIRIAASMTRKIRHIRENKNAFHFNNKVFKFSDDELDPYYTLVNYYNTIKNLGAAIRMYEDTIPHYIGVIIDSEKNFQKENNAKKNISEILRKEELTGRITATEIPNILQSLETKLDSKEVLDALLCTNMLSVGVDIDRLSMLIINGQPKRTSEYIQASGRIGRSNPGIVVTNYTYINPRDLSYFENFIYFHASYHKLIESSTLTPYSGRSRDRGLTGIFLALIRLQDDILSTDPMAFNMTTPRISKLVEQINDQILQRVKDVDPEELEQTKLDLYNIIKKWEDIIKITKEKKLKYRRNPFKKKDEENVLYLMNSSRDTYKENVFTVIDSLRDAESEINLYYHSRYG